MKALTLFRYFRNYVEISVTGGFCERFINLCNKEKINLWNVACKDRSINANVYTKDFFRLRDICRKSGTTLKIISKRGLYFDLIKQRKRCGLLIGMAFSLIFMLTMNLFVWDIETVGSENISREEILATLKNVGLDYGVFSPLFDESEASRKAINLFDGKVLWLAVNIKGSKATVEVRDLEESDKSNIKTDPSNLMANFDGIIIQARTLSGVQSADIGETVVKGQILISGVFENEDGSVLYQRSDGDFTALHSKNLQTAYDKSFTFERAQPDLRFKILSAFHVNLPTTLKLRNIESTQSYSRYLSVNKNILPFGITESIVFTDKIKEDKDVDNIYSIDRFSAEEYETMKNTLILSSDYKLTKSENKFNISCDYQCIDYIGEEMPLNIENINL